MRPAVYASVIRNRKHSARRVVGLKHEFSKRQMILMLFIGSLLVIFGLIVTIIGLVKGGSISDVHGDRVLIMIHTLSCGISSIAFGHDHDLSGDLSSVTLEMKIVEKDHLETYVIY
ncbi:hypothetical protein ACJMK2_033561 [Sinanodonta woodiana]|uniref:Uncharacterized protein n=1 Tax=Sinanodonta woodiana TaxID=1069815 RepID=A0ABD3WNT3_SINWO